MSERRPPGAVLIADIGGTNARFALVGDSPRDLHGIEGLACADFEHGVVDNNIEIQWLQDIHDFFS